MKDLSPQEAIKKACEEPTLADAVTSISIWEHERRKKEDATTYGIGNCIGQVIMQWREDGKAEEDDDILVF